MTEQTPQDADAGWYSAVIDRDQARAIEYLDDDYNLVVLYPTFARVSRAEWLAMLPDYVVSGWDTVCSEWDVAGDLAVHLALGLDPGRGQHSALAVIGPAAVEGLRADQPQ